MKWRSEYEDEEKGEDLVKESVAVLSETLVAAQAKTDSQ